MVAPLAIATCGSSVALTVTAAAAASPSPKESGLTERETAGCVSSSVRVTSVAVTVRPGALPRIEMVSSSSKRRSSTGVTVAVTVPERAFAGIVTLSPPLRA